MSETSYPHRVPEHPGWQDTWLRVAEYGDRRLVLHTWLDLSDDDKQRWGICDGTCDAEGQWFVGTYASLADAEVAFEEACGRLGDL